MTTPPTPSGWYPDPEQAGLLRYWDGAAWTEHRSPVQEPPTESAAPVASPEGAHPAPDAEPATEQPGAATEQPGAATEQPTTEVPLREWSFEPPPLEPEAPPESMFRPEPTPAEPAAEQPVPLTEQPTTKVPLRDWTAEPAPGTTTETTRPEPAPYADATTPTPAEPPAVEPPAGTEPSVPVDNRKLIVGFGGAVAALLLVLALAAVYAFVIHKPDTRQLSSPSAETSTTTTVVTQAPETTASEPASPPPLAGAADGPLTFAITGVESGTTVTDPENEFLTKDAQGEFIVVRLTVQNTSPDPGQFLGTFQKLKAAGQVYSIDDEATFYVGGGFVDIPPGGQVDVGLAYDVPPGTVPETIELHADPTSPGVELPVG